MLISTTDLNSILDDSNILIIDTRSFAEYSEGHIPGSVNLDLFAFHWIDTTPEGIQNFNKQTEMIFSFVGVSSEKKVVFYEDPYNPGGNSYYKETTGYFTKEHAQDKIMNTVDNVRRMNKYPQPDLIKIDAQGAELDILKGAADTLKYCRDLILELQHTNYNEGAPLKEEVIEYLAELGFDLVQGGFCLTQVDGDYHFRNRNLV